MSRIIFFLIIFSFATEALAEVNRYQIGNLVIENIPSQSSPSIQKLGAYQNVRAATFCDWLPDDKGILIATRFGETYQLHLVEMPKGMRRQLTFFDEPVSEGFVCPDPKIPYCLFTKDSGGDEVYQIFKFNFENETYERLTDGKSRHSAIIWSNQGDKFTFSSNMRNGRDFDIYIGSLAGSETFRPIIKKNGYWYAVDWSLDDQSLLVKEYVSVQESHYYIFNIAGQSLVKINPSNQKIGYGSAQWSNNNKGLFLISDQFSDFRQLLYYDIERRKFEVLTKAIAWDIEDFDLTPDGKTIAFISNEEGFSKLYTLNVESRTINEVHLPKSLVYNLKFKPDGQELAFVLSTSKIPGEVYSINLKEKTLSRWTYSELGGLDTNSFIQPQLIGYQTFDRVAGAPRLIPAFYYKPENSQPPYPVLIDCHGGPEGQALPLFASLTQFLLKEMGIAVIEPNVRGSSGYGKKYLALDNGYKREDAVHDIGALIGWISKQSDLDSTRIGIIGGSYGGYLVLAAMVLYGDRIRCGIDQWGISNFLTFLKNTGAYRQDLRRVEYGDEREPKMGEFLNKISPLTNVHKIKKPMFIVQGLNDPRVPVTEAEQIVKAIRKNGVDVWYLLALDEGHGFGKKPNRDYYRQALIKFLERYLLK